ncbi:MAG: hypothetical protein ABIU84_12460, partial [Thermoanaerobaculia bacterium]
MFSRSEELWKASLDSLVTHASPEARELLALALESERAAKKPDVNFVEWILEALEQVEKERGRRAAT